MLVRTWLNSPMVSTEELLRQIAELQDQVDERHAQMARTRSRERDQRTIQRTTSVDSGKSDDTDEFVGNSVNVD